MKIIIPPLFPSINRWKTTVQNETSNSPLARLSIAGSNHGLSCREDFTIDSENWHFSKEMPVINGEVRCFSKKIPIIDTMDRRFYEEIPTNNTRDKHFPGEIPVIDTGNRHFSREIPVIDTGDRYFSRVMHVIAIKKIAGIEVSHDAGLALETYENKKPQISQMTQIFFSSCSFV